MGALQDCRLRLSQLSGSLCGASSSYFYSSWLFVAATGVDQLTLLDVNGPQPQVAGGLQDHAALAAISSVWVTPLAAVAVSRGNPPLYNGTLSVLNFGQSAWSQSASGRWSASPALHHAAFNCSAGSDPTRRQLFGPLCGAAGLYVSQQTATSFYAYVTAAASHTLSAWSLPSSSASPPPALLGSLHDPLLGGASALAVLAGVAYVATAACGARCLVTVAVSSPGSMSVTGSVDALQSNSGPLASLQLVARGVALDAAVSYVADPARGRVTSVDRGCTDSAAARARRAARRAARRGARGPRSQQRPCRAIGWGLQPGARTPTLRRCWVSRRCAARRATRRRCTRRERTGTRSTTTTPSRRAGRRLRNRRPTPRCGRREAGGGAASGGW